MLIGPFKVTHASRNVFLEFKTTDSVTVLSERVSPKAYAKLVDSFDFIVCPRGNGIDTHRLWESLYRGRIPILIQSEHTQYFKDLDLPLLLLKSFDEIFDLTSNQLIQIATEMEFDPKMVTALQPEFWWNYIQTRTKG